jgi:signal transduction histidine kinase
MSPSVAPGTHEAPEVAIQAPEPSLENLARKGLEEPPPVPELVLGYGDSTPAWRWRLGPLMGSAARPGMAALVAGGAFLAASAVVWSLSPGGAVGWLAVIGGGSIVAALTYLALLLASRTRERSSLTASRRAQDALLESLLSAVDSGILVAEDSGQILLANPAAARLFGPAPTGVPIREWSQAYGIFKADGVTPCPTEELPLARALGGEVVETEDLFVRNLRVIGGLWVAASAKPLPTSTGGAARAVLVFHDITARRLGEDLAEAARLSSEAASRAKAQFLARMSHDLRTPMNAIIGFASLLAEGKPALSDEQARYVEYILSAGDELLNKIGNVLDLSHAAAGVTQLDYRSFDLVEALCDVSRSLHSVAEQCGVTVGFEDSGSECVVTADELRIKRSLSELLANAIKFSPHGGKVEIRLSRREPVGEAAGDERPRVRITIEDQGSGVAERDQERIFSGLEAGDTSYASPTQNGMGVGLALARSLVELHGGWVWLESEGVVGRGSRVHLEIPETPRSAEGAP